MSFSLSDLPAAVADYVTNHLTIEVSAVQHGISTVLQPNEKGTFHVTVTNKGAVRLTDLIYELSVSPKSVAQLISPTDAVVFAQTSLGGTPIPNGREVDTMFLSAIDAVSWTSVDGGASVSTLELEVKTQSWGRATIECTVRATVDQSSLFPPEQEGPSARCQLTVS
jgi:hypothetical protein